MWEEFHGTALPAEQAWRIFDDWVASGQEIGILFCGKAGTISTLGRVCSARNGRLQIQGEGAGAWLNLKGATFTRGPLQVYPRWPAGPAIEVMAIQAYLSNGDWLALAEGVVPASLGPMMLPA
jgi:hypothetical protein